MRGLLTATVAALMLLSIASAADNAAPNPADLDFFESKVRPVLVNHCWKCHGPKRHESGLRLDSLAALLKGGEGGAVVKPGGPDKSCWRSSKRVSEVRTR